MSSPQAVGITPFVLTTSTGDVEEGKPGVLDRPHPPMGR
jgi:hypothetical protein